jgi:hypothetical protein
MENAKGLLAVWMEVAPENEDDLAGWYHEEHLKERIEIPGFITAIRYVSLEGSPKNVALYDLDDPEVLRSEPYRHAQQNSTEWTRRIGRLRTKSARIEYELLASSGAPLPAPSPAVYVVRSEGQPERDAETVGALEEALTAMAAVPGVLRARLYRAADGTPRYFAYYELENAGVAKSEAWQKAASGPAMTRAASLVTNIEPNLAEFVEAGKKP